jgi:hypothetical protein
MAQPSAAVATSPPKRRAEYVRKAWMSVFFV